MIEGSSQPVTPPASAGKGEIQAFERVDAIGRLSDRFKEGMEFDFPAMPTGSERGARQVTTPSRSTVLVPKQGSGRVDVAPATKLAAPPNEEFAQQTHKAGPLSKASSSKVAVVECSLPAGATWIPTHRHTAPAAAMLSPDGVAERESPKSDPFPRPEPFATRGTTADILMPNDDAPAEGNTPPTAADETLLSEDDDAAPAAHSVSHSVPSVNGSLPRGEVTSRTRNGLTLGDDSLSNSEIVAEPASFVNGDGRQGTADFVSAQEGYALPSPVALAALVPPQQAYGNFVYNVRGDGGVRSSWGTTHNATSKYSFPPLPQSSPFTYVRSSRFAYRHTEGSAIPDREGRSTRDASSNLSPQSSSSVNSDQPGTRGKYTMPQPPPRWSPR